MRRISIVLLIVFATSIFPFSIWNSAGESEYKNLLSIKKASKVGDILTIVIRESNNVSSERESLEIQKTLLNILGNVVNAAAGVNLNNFIPINNNSPERQRGGKVQSSVVAKISAVVVDIDPYGNLVVEGRKTIKVDKDYQEIIVKGKVRPDDIEIGNEVDSSKLADSEIWVNGKLVFSEEPGKESFFDKILAFLAGLFT
ncbi:flagellar L-ring protein FlgH [Thermotoga maritima MSB8]|uniref:Flagellar L-ring protein n=1 Tax=Thermotoga maritima (strain ATCC 43589 / DSM 3109 / JCM 10099 / NBRC 100826 / MSB8) TaxID=243274 RepID=FLGH_THEMA|nr:flagellar basal body L-ring protein FlgH [Thermotoga maritima]Q9X1M6.1 RecName: Full=Flagellar L-ring protein; AltName: Full=Basal body L-ring protein; Flags: Precursor [Thermotoga maritima MSB8]AAD36607.1 flagellar L-ring protein [Thermotoga maritima MSB8]AGL50472.1 Flagellar L-ring protein FlgH [Thermotoga maritima MSB8]AHD18562.1 flagellar L-ring protein FlgH [Thermotoga maritima MSB8]AKE27429.1 flagellar L-ring protein FlgH [Thermotoga maritima]AKE29301.1 flagellar L-ring protein FlgH 